jgi:hypothetical protein
MLNRKVCVFTPWWAPALFLALLTFNLAAQAQPAAATTKSIFQRMPTPNPGGDQFLLGISADSEQDIWAIGDFLSLNFNGQSWTSVPLLFPGGEASMRGVTAISPTDVWSVGSTLVNSTHLIAVIEHYDGKQWKIVASPQFSTGCELHNIQAFSANDIFAVGESNSDSQQGQPLVEHYDGTTWSVVQNLPLKKGEIGVLNAIAGVSGTDFWIAGAGGSQLGVFGTPIVMHFDGREFKRVAFLGTKLDFGGITAITTDDAWIVGTNGSTLTAHWDGQVWKVVPSPGVGIFSSLTGVSAISSTEVWASGRSEESKNGNLLFNYLVEHWDGKSWTISPVPATKGGFDIFFGAQAFPSGNVFMVGSALDCIGVNCLGFAPAVFHTTQGK